MASGFFMSSIVTVENTDPSRCIMPEGRVEVENVAVVEVEIRLY